MARILLQCCFEKLGGFGAKSDPLELDESDGYPNPFGLGPAPSNIHADACRKGHSTRVSGNCAAVGYRTTVRGDPVVGNCQQLQATYDRWLTSLQPTFVAFWI